MSKEVGITVSKSENFSEWYTQVVLRLVFAVLRLVFVVLRLVFVVLRLVFVAFLFVALFLAIL